MRSRAVLLALLVVCALLAPVAGPAAAQGATQQASPTDSGDTVTSMRVQLRPDGAAEWNVTMRFEVEDNGTAFADVATAFESGEADVGPSVETFEALAARGSDATGREMSITGVDRRGWRPDNETGALTLTFTWNEFAGTGADRVNVSGAFGETWDLGANQRLVISPPTGYLPSDFQPGTDNGISNGVLRWEGPRTFVNGQPRIAYSTTNGGGTSANTTTPGGPGGDSDWAGLAVGAFLLALLALGGYVLYTRESDEEEASAEEPVAPDPEPTPEPDEEPTGDTAEGESESAVDETLLSDEERVERLLERNDGRMKQATIVQETGWSNAKVSQLLSAMAEAGDVEKLRIGRENLISLPEAGENDDGGE